MIQEGNLVTNNEKLCIALRDYIHSEWGDRNGHDMVGGAVEVAVGAVRRILQEYTGIERWLYFRLGLKPGERTGAFVQQAALRVRHLKCNYPIEGWWWLNKRDADGAAIRLRIRIPISACRDVETAIKAELLGLDRQLTSLCYEPEICLFGGISGAALAHKFMCADSEFIADWMMVGHGENLQVIPEGLSLAIILRLLRSAGLDLFETWDVFDRVCEKRSAKSLSAETILTLRRFAQKLLIHGCDRVFSLYSDTRAVLIEGYQHFLDSFGADLQHAYFQGRLECGLREFLAPLILFHWNRAALAPAIQAGLAIAMASELEIASRKGTSTEAAERVTS